jgi:hypothetical protein
MLAALLRCRFRGSNRACVGRGSGRNVRISVDYHRAGVGRGVAPGVGGDVVDGVGCRLRCVDDDVAHEGAVQKCFVAEVMALVVGDDGAEVGIGIANDRF